MLLHELKLSHAISSIAHEMNKYRFIVKHVGCLIFIYRDEFELIKECGGVRDLDEVKVVVYEALFIKISAIPLWNKVI
jgi:hypothetical protein